MGFVQHSRVCAHHRTLAEDTLAEHRTERPNAILYARGETRKADHSGNWDWRGSTATLVEHLSVEIEFEEHGEEVDQGDEDLKMKRRSTRQNVEGGVRFLS